MQRDFSNLVTTAMISILCLLMTGQGLAADDGSQKHDDPRIDVPVIVLDEMETPVAGVAVIPWAVRSTGGHGLWKDDVHGPRSADTTDNAGRATISSPSRSYDEHSVTSLSVHLVHPDYCKTSTKVPIPPGNKENGTAEPARLQIEPGTRLSFDLTNVQGQPVTSNCYVLLQVRDEYTRNCVPDQNGRLVTGVLPNNGSPLRIVHLPDEGPPQFSEPYTWSADNESTHHAKISIAPGARIQGQLDRDVPRPVKNGHVIGVVTDPVEDAETPYLWRDVASVAEDGTFEFASLPQGRDIQVIAVCDGYLSTEPLDIVFDIHRLRYPSLHEPISDFRHYPQVYAMTGNRQEFVVGMQPAARCRIQLVDPQDQPIKGLRVQLSPNQYFLGCGSSIVGTGYRSAEHLRSGQYIPIRTTTYAQTSDAYGVVQFDNLPPGYLRRLRVSIAERQSLTFRMKSPLTAGEMSSITKIVSWPEENRQDKSK